MNKDEARRKARARKSMLTEAERLNAAAEVFDQLEKLAAFMMADHVLMYHSLPDELSTLAFLDKWHGSKRMFLPRVNGVNLDILPYTPGALGHGAYGIEEPQGHDTVDLGEIDMVVVPGMAYDRNGNRVGRGKGYYDRLLSGCKAVKVGVAYDCQMMDSIDTDGFDQPVDIVITETRTYLRRPRRKNL